jgi:cob(I)alamin adenosyltransferase
MGNRLSKIYTRTGDDGSTGLADGNRIAKNAQRVEAMGMADELTCHASIWRPSDRYLPAHSASPV